MIRTEYRWSGPAEIDNELVSRLSKELEISPVLTGILIRRGYTDSKKMHDFLYPDLASTNDPFLMKDMKAAVERLETAVRNKEKIFIHGDYDVDGLTSVALLEKVLGNLGLPVCHYIPNRLSEGYGVSQEGIRQAHEDGAQLLITVDCGIVAHEEIKYANSLGLDVIVTDHHESGPEIPEAVAVINPKQRGCPYPDKELAGIGVAFKLCQALYRCLGEDETYLYSMLDMVALGTIADVAPITGENRVFVARGLEVLQDSPNKALAALLRSSGLYGKDITANHVAFSIAPRINAVGRMGDSQKVVSFLTTEQPREAGNMAMILEQENKKRQRIDSVVLQEAKRKLENFDPEEEWAIVLASEDWHQGVLGIVASRLVEQFRRPVVLISLDESGTGRGSARSVSSFHLYDALTACRDLLIEYGGHQYAAGLKINKDNIEDFRLQLNRLARSTITPLSLEKELVIDAEVSMAEVNSGLCRELKRTAPNGTANPKPLLLLRGLSVDGSPRTVGDGHLKVKFKSKHRTLDAIGFKLGDRAEELSTKSGLVDIVFTIGENTWQGTTVLQAKLKDLRITYDN